MSDPRSSPGWERLKSIARDVAEGKRPRSRPAEHPWALWCPRCGCRASDVVEVNGAAVCDVRTAGPRRQRQRSRAYCGAAFLVDAGPQAFATAPVQFHGSGFVSQ